MKKFILFLTLIGWTTPSFATEVPTDILKKLVGSYHLMSLEEDYTASKGKKVEATGSQIIAGDGHVSIQVMNKTSDDTKDTGPVKYSQNGYEASFGTLKINDDLKSYTYHIDGALIRRFLNENQVRVFEIKGRRLIVRSSDLKEHWRATWEKD